MPDPALTTAIKEAYASAPADQVILHTIALYHSDWKDEDGNPVTLYFVRDQVDHNLTIEAGAKRDAGKSKLFRAVAFDLTLPELKTTSVPSVTITVDNVGGELFPYIDAASASRDKVTVTYRPYLSTDTTEPQMNPPLELTLSEISVTTYQVKGKAMISDMGRRKFPQDAYELSTFPALANS